MKKHIYFFSLICFVMILTVGKSYGQLADFESRRQAYLSQGITGDPSAVTVQAFTGNPVNAAELTALLADISNSENVDFNWLN